MTYDFDEWPIKYVHLADMHDSSITRDKHPMISVGALNWLKQEIARLEKEVYELEKLRREEQLTKEKQILVAALKAVVTQNRARGYPTASEWIILEYNAREALAKLKY